MIQLTFLQRQHSICKRWCTFFQLNHWNNAQHAAPCTLYVNLYVLTIRTPIHALGQVHFTILCTYGGRKFANLFPIVTYSACLNKVWNTQLLSRFVNVFLKIIQLILTAPMALYSDNYTDFRNSVFHYDFVRFVYCTYSDCMNGCANRTLYRQLHWFSRLRFPWWFGCVFHALSSLMMWWWRWFQLKSSKINQ